MSLIPPHGGTLVDRILKGDAAAKASQEAKNLKNITLSPREAFDLEMIAIGAFSPVVGFLGEQDFARVCREMRLANGVVWPIPVILSPADEVTAKINVGERVARILWKTGFVATREVASAKCLAAAARIATVAALPPGNSDRNCRNSPRT